MGIAAEKCSGLLYDRITQISNQSHTESRDNPKND